MEATWAGTVAATAGKVHPAATKEAGMVVAYPGAQAELREGNCTQERVAVCMAV